MSEKSPIEKLKSIFLQRRILEIGDVYKIIHTTSRTTAYRYLQKVGSLSSYSHAGKYYTLKEIPQFDEDGLWHYGDISFSKYGTLMDTIVHLIAACEEGKTCSELEKQQRVYVQNALLSLVRSKKIARKEIDGVYVYVSTDPKQCSLQIQQRHAKERVFTLPEWMVVQVLVATIKCISKDVTAEEVTSRLKRQGSSITLDQVKKVFQEYSIQKKTSDFTPSGS